MSNTEQIPIKRNMTQEQLNKKIKELEKEIRILDKLNFINYRYQGYTVDEASKKIGITKRVGYIWQERWNKDGYEGLKPKYHGGKASKLTPENLKKLEHILKEDNITDAKQIRQIIKEEFNIIFSDKHV